MLFCFPQCMCCSLVPCSRWVWRMFPIKLLLVFLVKLTNCQPTVSCSNLSKPPCFVVCSRAEQIPPCLTSESSLPSPWGTPALSRKRYWSNNRSQSLLVWVFFFCVQLYINVDFVLCNFNYFLSIWYLCFCFLKLSASAECIYESKMCWCYEDMKDM